MTASKVGCSMSAIVEISRGCSVNCHSTNRRSIRELRLWVTSHRQVCTPPSVEHALTAIDPQVDHALRSVKARDRPRPPGWPLSPSGPDSDPCTADLVAPHYYKATPENSALSRRGLHPVEAYCYPIRLLRITHQQVLADFYVGGPFRPTCLGRLNAGRCKGSDRSNGNGRHYGAQRLYKS